jgi:hypothetical protein
VRKFILTLLGIIAVLAFSLYATIGETGPIGWINAAQARSDGTYSRAISAFVLLIGVCLIVMGGIYVIEFFQKIRRAVLGPVAARPASVAAPAATPVPTDSAAKVAPLKEPTSGPSGWRMGLAVWAVFHSLVWGCLFAWYGWDWHLRRADVVSTYVPMQLSRGVEPTHPDGGSHLALLGGTPLWDHAVTRRSSKSSNVANAIYVPLATADWRMGDPVYFVAQLDNEQQLYDLQRAAGGVDEPVLVRVDGAVAGAARPVFERNGVPVGDSAVAVTAVMSRAGRPTQADPPFDWMSLLTIGIIVTGLFTLLPLAGVLGLKREEWIARRREARAAREAA